MFPLFRVGGIGVGEAGGVVGTVTRTTHGRESWVGERWLGFLKVGTTLVAGRWHARGDNWEFVLKDPELAELVLAHPELEILDGYWGERAELVLDKRRQWDKVRFQPTDAMRVRGPGGVTLSRADGSTTSAALPSAGGASVGEETSGAEVVPAGWDHEHCEICWEKIGAGGQVEGYVSTQRAWVCSRCYVDFVEQRSLGFIPGPSDQD